MKRKNSDWNTKELLLFIPAHFVTVNSVTKFWLPTSIFFSSHAYMKIMTFVSPRFTFCSHINTYSCVTTISTAFFIHSISTFSPLQGHTHTPTHKHTLYKLKCTLFCVTGFSQSFSPISSICTLCKKKNRKKNKQKNKESCGGASPHQNVQASQMCKTLPPPPPSPKALKIKMDPSNIPSNSSFSLIASNPIASCFWRWPQSRNVCPSSAAWPLSPCVVSARQKQTCQSCWQTHGWEQ